ncbi:MAG: hypothetical protein OXI87_11085 [Albidovulum sp.]|nr:hypothetical protein [Albidovulum sp.]MDE0534482.1 hypothetical protein [Albidovulum sp.]
MSHRPQLGTKGPSIFRPPDEASVVLFDQTDVVLVVDHRADRLTHPVLVQVRTGAHGINPRAGAEMEACHRTLGLASWGLGVRKVVRGETADLFVLRGPRPEALG